MGVWRHSASTPPLPYLNVRSSYQGPKEESQLRPVLRRDSRLVAEMQYRVGYNVSRFYRLHGFDDPPGDGADLNARCWERSMHRVSRRRPQRRPRRSRGSNITFPVPGRRQLNRKAGPLSFLGFHFNRAPDLVYYTLGYGQAQPTPLVLPSDSL